ncbi:hypothetical protein DYGSA30_30740 [Dyella sp. GSA-30]|nr:hypothetical protein DYGSA30_30740 [Dyella sp. GSA-30]
MDDRVDAYKKDLADTAYRDVRIRDLMMMASGTSFNENYDDPNSSIAKFFGLVNRNQGGLYEYVRSFGSERPAGTVFRYSSADTEVLGAVLESATHEHLADFASQELWSRVGAEADAYWVLDAPDGREVSAGGFSARARDLARFGMVFADAEKKREDGGIVSRAWIRDAITPQRQFAEFGNLSAGRGIVPGADLGYGYQWWLRRSPDLTVVAMGMYGQFILIDPKRGSVLVVTSAWERPYIREHYEEVLALFESLQTSIDSACQVRLKKKGAVSQRVRPEWCAV